VRVERFLWDAARRFPDKTAIVCGEARPTYRQLADAAAGLARELKLRGLRRGERVIILLQNSPEAVLAVFGTLAAGGVFSVINPSTKADKLAYILNNARASALITEPRLAAVANEAAARALGHEHPDHPVRFLGRRAAGRRDRSRPGDDHLHLGVDRLPEGRDDDARQHRRGSDLDHHLS
jgi:acyl-CoA synthetase (AMP-forming)/AMP-acid ligase II